MKKIYLDFTGKMHPVFDDMLRYPPEGYEFVSGEGLGKKLHYAARIQMARQLFEGMDKLFPVKLLANRLMGGTNIPQGVDLVYSDNHLVFKKIPWVVDVEFASQFADYKVTHFKRSRKLIQKSLSSDSCKGLICWSEWSRQTLLRNIKDSAIEKKIHIAPFTTHKRDFLKTYSRDRIKLLFVGSTNAPQHFFDKGAHEVLKSFVQIKDRNANVDLTMRVRFPEHLKSSYSGLPGLKIIDQPLSQEELEHQFQTADIFVFPTHRNASKVILEAMANELPVISTGVFDVPEMVMDNETGFLVDKSEKVRYEGNDLLPDWDRPAYYKAIRIPDPKRVNQIAEKIELLINDEALRRRMGRAGREKVETGKFSIQYRRSKLKSIFDKAISNGSELS